MELSEAINKRQSIRDFSDQEIPEDTLRKIISDANRAPSWANSQPWEVLIATGDTLASIKKEHKELSERGVSGNSDFETTHRGTWSRQTQVNMSDWSQQVYSTLQGKNSIFHDSQVNLFNAPALVYLVLPKNATAWSIYDLGAFSENLMLSATDSGVQSIPAYEIVKYPQSIRNYFDLDDSKIIAMGIALGYAKDNLINDIYTERQNLDDILTIKK